MKKLKGFSLVELVIVIAIIGIMATVAMPNMIGRVQKSKYDTANSRAKSIFNSAQTIVMKYETIDRAITVDPAKKRLNGVYVLGNVSGIIPSPYTTGEMYDEIYKKLAAMNNHLDDGKWILVIEGYNSSGSGYKVRHVLWSETETDSYVGVYCDCGSNHSLDFETYINSGRENIKDKWNTVNT